MKHTIAILLLAFTGLCFKPAEEDKDKASFYATVDGKLFKLQENQMLRGILVNKSASMDGRSPAKTVINANFNGLTYDKPDGTSSSESISFDMSYEESKLGEPANYSVALQYSTGDYYMAKDLSKIRITEITWETDRKHFKLSADFDCTMHSLGYPMDKKKDVSLKGHITNLRITVPSWYTQKN